MLKTISLILVSMLSVSCFAVAPPALHVSFDASDGVGEKVEEGVTTFEGSAPITAIFHFTFDNLGDWTPMYEWRFCHEGGTLDEPYMIRYESDPEIVFTQGVTDSIALYCTLTNGKDAPIEMRREYWTHENEPLTIKTSESNLVFPNAFTPNGDGKNDYYKPKSFQSIVEFRAIIFNRWGQKLYEWTDITADGWDGKFHGHDVKQGVYFALIRAKGADGTVFEFKKDVNLLRTYDAADINSADAGAGF